MYAIRNLYNPKIEDREKKEVPSEVLYRVLQEQTPERDNYVSCGDSLLYMLHSMAGGLVAIKKKIVG